MQYELVPVMLAIVHPNANMTDAVVNQTPSEEILEDGEIDDEEEEIITEETEVVEGAVEELGSHSQSHANDTSSEYYAKSDQISSLNEPNDVGDNDSGDEDRKRSHKKHQRKRKKHRDSKERELRAEKKERRRKRKMHAHEDTMEHQEHGGSLSPHSKRRRKKKKHSKDRRDRDSTTPDSDDSIEQYPPAYYANNNGYVDDYTMENSMYHSTKQTYNASSNSYYSQAVDQVYDQTDSKEYGNDSASDFEAQLAEYKNYKTHGDSYQQDQNHEDKKSNKSSSSANAGEMYEEFMEYEENPKRLCKFFAEGKCLKGNECSFSHDQSARRGKAKKREMCKYYLAGHCHHGNQCTYMHAIREYPCKYFHTGVTCYAGDNCRFSHDSPTAETKEIIENFKDILGNVDDSWEVSELAKLGITVRPKPPPGVGLLPTPDVPPIIETEQPSSASGTLAKSTRAIPSIFDISVAPSAELQKRIDENNVASLSMNDESRGMSESMVKQLPPQLYPNPINRMANNKNGGGLLPTPTTMPMNPNMFQQDSSQSDENNYYGGFYNDQDADDGDKHLNSEDKSTKSEDDIIKTEDEFIRMEHSTTEEEQIEEEPVKVPDFLPATQKALFMRIHGNRAPSDKDSGRKNVSVNDSWAYSSDEDEKPSAADPGIIKMDVESPSSSSDAAATTSSAVQSLLNMISKAGNSAHFDTNLLSKVASVINMPTTEHYNPATSIATYNPAQNKGSPRHVSATRPRERKTSGSLSTSPGHSTKHHKAAPIRRRLSTQELTKEPVVIPLVSKQSGNQSMHAAHPDPRITLSRLIGAKPSRFSATLPRFSKDLILPGSEKLHDHKLTPLSEDSKQAKRDPRLDRRKDPRLQRTNDPRLKNRNATKSSVSNSTTVVATEVKSSIPSKPPALLSKSSTTIPSLPELDLNLAYLRQVSKENGDSDTNHKSKVTSAPSYSLPALKLPKLVKAPSVTSPLKDSKPDVSPTSEPSVQPVALYDPRYMSCGLGNSSSSSDLPISTALYDPRTSTSLSSTNSGTELRKRTIQLPKLTPAPSYKPIGSSTDPDKPEGDQGDF